MEMRIDIAPDGQATIVSISVLEDLWHDYVFFKARAGELDQPSCTATDALVAKRYYRVALLTLVFYFEGVLNRWLQQLGSDTEWQAEERRGIERKMELIRSRVQGDAVAVPDVGAAKTLRNTLAHLKAGADLEIYDMVNRDLLDQTEQQVDRWLHAIEQSTSLRRHPDTRAASRELVKALGHSVAEGYTGEDQ